MESKNNLSKEEIENIQQDLFNDIFLHKNYINEFYSTNELKSLFNYANYNKEKINLLLENYTKEENLKKIQDKVLQEINKKNEIQIIKTIKKINKKFIIQSRFLISENTFSNKNLLVNVWAFINNGTNIIDLKDALTSFNKEKLYSKIKKEFLSKKNKSKYNNDAKTQLLLINEFEKRFEEKEKKFMSMYINHFEENDIEYLKIRKQWNIFQHIPKPNLIQQLIINKILNLPLSLRNFIFSYVSIFTLGRLGLCSKILYKTIYEDYSFNNEHLRIYVNALFINSNLYLIKQKNIKSQFSNNLDLIKNKKRIRFCGIYYCKVKSIINEYKFGEENHNSVFFFYRLLRFFPNGLVYTMTTPFFKNAKIKQGIRNGIIELKCGKWTIDEDDNLKIVNDNLDEYIYKLGWSDFYRIRYGYNKDDIGVLKGFELTNYYMANKNGEKIEIPLDENFPKRFRYRALNTLENDIYIYKDISF